MRFRQRKLKYSKSSVRIHFTLHAGTSACADTHARTCVDEIDKELENDVLKYIFRLRKTEEGILGRLRA